MRIVFVFTYAEVFWEKSSRSFCSWWCNYNYSLIDSKFQKFMNEFFFAIYSMLSFYLFYVLKLFQVVIEGTMIMTLSNRVFSSFSFLFIYPSSLVSLNSPQYPSLSSSVRTRVFLCHSLSILITFYPLRSIYCPENFIILLFFTNN